MLIIFLRLKTINSIDEDIPFYIFVNFLIKFIIFSYIFFNDYSLSLAFSSSYLKYVL